MSKRLREPFETPTERVSASNLEGKVALQRSGKLLAMYIPNFTQSQFCSP